MQVHHRALISIIAAFVLMAGTVFAALRNQSQNTSTQVTEEDATPIRKRLKSERQKAHGKLFKNKGVGNIHELVREHSAENGDDELNIESLPGTPELSPTGQSNPNASKLAALVSRADLIIVGVVKSKVSQLNETETFLFTDYELNVSEVVKNNSTAPVTTHSNITVTRPGGVVELEGKIVRAVDRTAKPLRIGEQYLLFLKYIPATGAYLASQGASSFKLSGGKVDTLTDDPLSSDFQKGKDALSLINDVRVAVAVSSER